ncbi:MULTISPECIES: family 1 glycosylhydrolase [unclassified Caballeronia]|uniref:family 1 glycosylhydrolase n=1 Tax=unclassified Caballeronia TaxID=2646786 RepID=UPI00285C9113|nr:MULTISPECIES: family 1 glycosylhydrolase [unclassified Caballeronia]MDR5741280.1 family 1 glycosylhydrolase [Caballeronia sp. LZ016]MDR5807178.1 family 1 glycosylhydrolase [Caballeronia sp. LZ019]
MEERLVLWGGLECTINRVRDRFFSQLDRNGHATRESDLERFASLGIEALRYPVLWERTAPSGIEAADWSWLDARLPELRDLGVEPIAGLLHHGSGPLPGGLLDPDFVERLAEFARAVAQRYPWLEYYTPVNEPNTTARFSGLYGVWHPHGTDDRTYLQALINQCKATVCAMREIRAFNPRAKLVQTDDLGKTQGTPAMAKLVDFYNERRWLSWDLLCGMVVPGHPLWQYFMDAGIAEDEVLWLADNPCPPDIIGINYYITSERWLDDRAENYPEAYRCDWYGHRLADIETARVLAGPTGGIRALIDEAWRRYERPLAITEAHIDATRQDQMRWLHEIWTAASDAREQGVDIRAVTVWALLGSYDWNCLVTDDRGYYESGPFDVRGTTPRETALAALMRDLAAGRAHDHPVLHGTGWWRRPGRFLCEPVVYDASGVVSLHARPKIAPETAPPILIIGRGPLGRAFEEICAQRDLRYERLPSDFMRGADAGAIDRLIDRHSPWAIINAGELIDVDEAERGGGEQLRRMMAHATRFAMACAKRSIRYVMFSSDYVFDGLRARPYVETDDVSPVNCYGSIMAQTEASVLRACPDALVVRTSGLFGPWDDSNFLLGALQALSQDRPFAAAHDLTISPTYAPDLVHACLDLLIDAEAGILHLSNRGAVTWADLAIQAATIANLNADLISRRTAKEMKFAAARPAYSALTSDRAAVLPTLDSALYRYMEHWRMHLRDVSDDASRLRIAR